MERETLEFDVVFVGAGPANLSGAYHLARLVKQNPALGDVEIAVIEKGSTVGAHILSGAVMDPKALLEPFTSVRTYRKASAPNDELREFSCAEGLGSTK